VRNQFITAINKNKAAFGLDLSDQQAGRLADYYDLVQEHNPLLHLVGPCSPEEFAVRHILESLTLLEHLPRNATFADVGTGAGLPSIPCLLVRDDLNALLIESKEKKAKFLVSAVVELGLGPRGNVMDRQFSEVDLKDSQIVTARALDRFAERLPQLLRWSGKRKCLLFGGPDLEKALLANATMVGKKLMPFSERRYLYIVSPQAFGASKR